MTNKELIDCCIMLRKDCIGCPYIRKECDQFIKETGYSPWMYLHQMFPSITDDDEGFFNFLRRDVRESE
ncbi:MAG: hypothetical protein J5662_07155 [Clostridia bacterium]|nr:hypothetical protein [Clostridia bacterium]